MKLNIGGSIKKLRKSKDITQEQLAEMLGVSCQSVSRWESGVCYPDMELLPTLSKIFETTVDKLLGVEDSIEKKKVDEYINRFQNAISVGEIDKSISIAREGVSEYPNNYELLNKLMHALFVAGDCTGNINAWKENTDKYDAEITSIGERIMRYCPDENIRLEAKSRLAFNHCEQGRKEIGRQIYETLPTITLCKENQMWWSLEENEKLPFLRTQIKENYNIIKNFMRTLAICEKLPPNESIAVIDKLELLDDLICDGKQHSVSLWIDIIIHYDKAKLYAKIGDEKSVYNQLKIAAEKAISFDSRPEIQKYNSLLLGNVEVKRSDFETADNRTLRKIMRDKWLADEAFDFIRNTTEFNEIISML